MVGNSLKSLKYVTSFFIVNLQHFLIILKKKVIPFIALHFLHGNLGGIEGKAF